VGVLGLEGQVDGLEAPVLEGQVLGLEGQVLAPITGNYTEQSTMCLLLYHRTNKNSTLRI